MRNRKINWELNTIAGGNYDPFVYCDCDGVHIGDRSNHEIFPNVAAALEYARQARLSGGTLSKANAANKNDPNGNRAAEYRWHEDAGLQIDALNALQNK